MQAMQYIHIKNGVAAATNSIVLIKVDLGVGDNPIINSEQMIFTDNKLIHKDIWKDMCKYDDIEFTETNIICIKNNISTTYPYGDAELRFPDYQTLIENLVEKKQEAREVISIEPKQINIISKIFGSDKILNLVFNEGNSGIFVFSEINNRMMAVLMPCFSDNKERYYF